MANSSPCESLRRRCRGRRRTGRGRLSIAGATACDEWPRTGVCDSALEFEISRRVVGGGEIAPGSREGDRHALEPHARRQSILPGLDLWIEVHAVDAAVGEILGDHDLTRSGSFGGRQRDEVLSGVDFAYGFEDEEESHSRHHQAAAPRPAAIVRIRWTFTESPPLRANAVPPCVEIWLDILRTLRFSQRIAVWSTPSSGQTYSGGCLSCGPEERR